MDKQKISQIIENTLSLLTLSSDQYSLEWQDGGVKIQVTLPEDQTGIYIGHHGEALTSLQLLLSLMVSQRAGDWCRVSLNVNDYQERREDSLKNLADSAADKALSLHQEVVLGNLSSYERRIVHLHLESRGDVTTESRGEPPLRQLIISPKD